MAGFQERIHCSKGARGDLVLKKSEVSGLDDAPGTGVTYIGASRDNLSVPGFFLIMTVVTILTGPNSMRVFRQTSVMYRLSFFALGLVTLAITWQITSAKLNACPFCAATAQTLRQEMATMDVVVLGELVTTGEEDINGSADFKVIHVWKGDDKVAKSSKVNAPYFGPGKSKKNFLLMGVGADEVLWSSPLPISSDTEKYLQEIAQLPDDMTVRLKYYLQFLEHSESMLARDAYDEFAQAPYDDVKKIKDSLPRNQILAWVKDANVAPDRKRLYYTLLEICGQKDDTHCWSHRSACNRKQVVAPL